MRQPWDRALTKSSQDHERHWTGRIPGCRLRSCIPPCGHRLAWMFHCLGCGRPCPNNGAGGFRPFPPRLCQLPWSPSPRAASNNCAILSSLSLTSDGIETGSRNSINRCKSDFRSSMGRPRCAPSLRKNSPANSLSFLALVAVSCARSPRQPAMAARTIFGVGSGIHGSPQPLVHLGRSRSTPHP